MNRQDSSGAILCFKLALEALTPVFSANSCDSVFELCSSPTVLSRACFGFPGPGSLELVLVLQDQAEANHFHMPQRSKVSNAQRFGYSPDRSGSLALSIALQEGSYGLVQVALWNARRSPCAWDVLWT